MRRGAPCLVFIHGGYWQMNGREQFASVMRGVVSHGWSAALPGYTLAPEATLGDIAGEIDKALGWLESTGPSHGIDGPIILSGWSAGGHLASLALGHPAAKAGLAISGIFDLGRLRETYINDRLRLSEGDAARYSPMRLPVVDKPLIVAYGGAELPALVAESRNFHAYRMAHGAPGDLVAIPDADHFTVLDALSAPDGPLTRRLLTLADAELGAPKKGESP
jgi:acetyl esterase/lipase